MNATFNDLQDKSNVMNGTRVRDSFGLNALLEPLKERQPFMFELVGVNGCTLLVGFSKDVGCVQFSASDGEPPYLMALNDDIVEDEPFISFLNGNTPTPVPRRFCLPIEQVLAVTGAFIDEGVRSDAVGWEEL
jgi:hypothetical protein